jgi:hypothetical protein
MFVGNHIFTFSISLGWNFMGNKINNAIEIIIDED